MSFENQFVVILICYFTAFLFIRGFLYGIKRYQLNNSAYKKRKNGETFKEWLLYNRYQEEIPKILQTLYYSVLIIHPACLIACLFVYIIKLPLNIGGILATFIAGFDVVWMLVIALLFWSPRRDYAYERWIPKKKRRKRDRQ